MESTFGLLHKQQKKPEEAIKMDNPETLATLCTQDTGQRKTTQNHKKLYKKKSNTNPPKNPGGEHIEY